MNKTTEEKALTFENAMEELENIVSKMEDSNLSLDKMMEYFEKGKKLSGYCGKQLSKYEKKIEILVNKKTKNNDEAWDEFQPENLL
jgi:exodeoxyribonuclease VII small subunit